VLVVVDVVVVVVVVVVDDDGGSGAKPRVILAAAATAPLVYCQTGRSLLGWQAGRPLGASSLRNPGRGNSGAGASRWRSVVMDLSYITQTPARCPPPPAISRLVHRSRDTRLPASLSIWIWISLSLSLSLADDWLARIFARSLTHSRFGVWPKSENLLGPRSSLECFECERGE